MRWSEEEYERFIKASSAIAPPFQLPRNETGAFALGRLPVRKMNKLEASYDEHLAQQKVAGSVLWYRFEPMNLRLADGATYKPDFGVLTRDCLFEFHETKGFWREAARVRIKVAAELFPFRFIAIKRAKTGTWEREEFA